MTAVFIQSHLLLSWDLSWSLSTTQKFLASGNYVTSFMDTNPPISIYIWIPTVLLAKSTGINSILILRIMVFSLGFLSLLTCHTITKRLFIKKEWMLQAALLIAISVCFFLLPTYEFGHREHLFLLLTIPYFLRVAALAENKNISWYHSTWIGLLAGIGFLLNIEYIILFLAVELYLIIKQKKWSVSFRIDSSIVLIMLVGYIVSIFLLTPAYISVILPLILFLHPKTLHYSWSTLFLNTAFISWFSVAILLPLHLKSTKQKTLTILFFIVITGCIIQFLFSQKIWYYHVLPTLAFSLLLLTLYLIYNLFDIRYSRQIGMTSEWKLLIKTVVVFSILVLFPIKTLFVYTRGALAYSNTPSNEINQLITYTKNHAEGKTIYVFSTTTAPGTTLADYGHVTLGSRFPSFWMLPGIIKRSKEKLNKKDQRKLKKARRLLFNSVVQDFKKYQPNYVFVSIAKYKGDFGDIQFNYIPYFSKDKRFEKIWKKYHRVNQIGYFSIYYREK